MMSESENAVDIEPCVLEFLVESPDQAASLANYFNAHGVEAYPEGSDSVRCPVIGSIEDIRHLRKSWRLFWKHSDAEVFGLSIYVKTACSEHQ